MSSGIKKYKGISVNNDSVEAIIEKLLELNDIDVPQDLVDEEIEIIIQELSSRSRYEAMLSPEDPGLFRTDLIDRFGDVEAQAYNQVKIDLILTKIIEAEGFVLTAQEIEEEMKAIAERQQASFEMVKGFLCDSDTLRKDLLEKKAIRFVIENATVSQ